jgi:diaminopimelate decarboxylase
MKNTWELLENLSNKYGESFYLLDSRKFKRNYEDLLKEFRNIYPNTFIAYSYKTNYMPKLCKIINNLGGYAEVVSEMEYNLAIKIGVASQNIIFNGPYKNEKIVEKLLLGEGIVNLDSYYELGILKKIATKNPDKKLSIGIRCNFDIKDSVISRFGFDVENDNLYYLFNVLKRFPNITIKGFHCHFPTRSIDSFIMRTEKMLNLTKKYFNNPPAFISLGGGFFGKMSPTLKKQFNFKVPNYREYAEVIANRFKVFYQDTEYSKKPKLILEPGSALVADTMKFVARVINIKEVRSKKIATISGSIYNISPTLNNKNLPITVYHNLKTSSTEQKYGKIDFGGYTCIESDYLYRGYNGLLGIGDYVVFDNVGSYSIVLKPPFILPNFAVIDCNSSEKSFELVKRKEKNDDIFRTFKF